MLFQPNIHVINVSGCEKMQPNLSDIFNVVCRKTLPYMTKHYDRLYRRSALIGGFLARNRFTQVSQSCSF